MIFYVEIFLFDLVGYFSLLVFNFFFRFLFVVTCFDIFSEGSFSFLSNCFCMMCISILILVLF